MASASEVNALKDSFSALDVGVVADIKTEDTVKQTPAVGITDCKCGMPLCICQVSATPTTSIASQERTYLLAFKCFLSKWQFLYIFFWFQQGIIMPNPIVNINPKPKKENKIPTSRASTSYNKQGYVTDVSSCPFGEIGPVYFLQRQAFFSYGCCNFLWDWVKVMLFVSEALSLTMSLKQHSPGNGWNADPIDKDVCTSKEDNRSNKMVYSYPP